MPANVNPNHNATSNLNGWTKGQSSGSTTLTSTADGARWVGTASGTGRYLRIAIPWGSVGYANYALTNMVVRRNGGAARLTRATLDGRRTIQPRSGGGTSTIGTVVNDDRLGDVFFRQGGTVVVPALAAALAAGNPDPEIWIITGNAAFYCYIYAEDNKAFDFTLRNLLICWTGDLYTQPAVDANDCTFSISQSNNSLTASGVWDKGADEAVTDLTWDWGDGSAVESGGATVESFQSRPHTYPEPGIYTMKLTASCWTGIGSGTTSSYTTKQVTVPVGPFQAAFDHQVSHPDLLVDASPSVAPTLSPVETYAWNWGDGSTGSGKTTSHTYAAPGVYNVTLTISNSVVNRTSSVTKSVMISAPDLATPAEQFAMALFLDDPASVVTSSGLQAEMVPIVVADEIKWNWTGNEIPTLSFRAPHDWLERTAPGVTLENLRSDIVLRLNFGNGWVEPPMARFIVDTVNSDPLNPQSLVTVKGLGIAADDLAGLFFTPEIVGDAYTSTERAAGYSRLYSTVNPGAILWDLLPVATTPGSGAPHLNYLNIDFSATLDSKGASWAHTLESVKVPPDSSGLDLLQNLIDLEAIDWYCRGNLLRVFNPGSSGVRGPSDSPPELLPGRDIKAAPQERMPIRSKCWGAVVLGDKGVPYTVSDTVSSNESYQRAAYRGRRYVAIQAGDVASSAGALATAKPPLANIYRTRDGEMVRELILGSNSPWMPYRDYHVGDVVLAPGPNGTLEVVSVVAITLTQSATGGIEGALILGNAYAVNGITKKIASLAGGSGISVGKARSTEGDTGWVTITPSSGYGFQSGYPLQIRRVGNLVKTRGLLTRTGGWTAGTQFTGVIAAIPAEFRPSQHEFFSGVGNTSHPNPVIIWNADGSLTVRTQSTVTPWVGIGASWFV